MEKILKLSISIKVKERIHFCIYIINTYRAYISNEYLGKSKNKYLKLLDRHEIPQIVCIDEVNEVISYKIKDRVVVKSGKMRWKIPIFNNRKDTAILTSISALYSGKKQEACSITVKKRRNPDGSYKGTEKTQQTIEKKGIRYSTHIKIIQNRRKNNTLYLKNKRTISDISRELSKIEPEYIILSKKYKDNRTKLTFLCNKGHKFKMKWNSLSSGGQRCPNCRVHKNEEECRQIFENLTGKKFYTKKPNFLKNPETGGNLELDGYCKELRLAFEYDGEQHYRSIDFFGGEVSFKKTKERDLIKSRLCKKYGITLIRIPYFVKDKENFIKEKVNGKNIK